MIDFENVKLEEIINGYTCDENGAYTCIYCGKVFEAGEVFQFGERFFDAARSVQIHVDTEHTERFTELIYTDSKYLSLTDNQRELLRRFYLGRSDKEVAKELQISPSTVRHQRFMFREKAKAAKMILAVWEMVESSKNKQADILLPVHEGAKMVDERYVITEEESKKIMKGVFESLEPLKLKIFSPKEKKKIVILNKIAEQFEKDRKYTEKEVNQILKDIYEDYVTIRRYLIEYGYMDRTNDGKSYWLK